MNEVQRSLQAEAQIDGPATANVRPIGAAVFEEFVVIAAGILEGIGENRELVESTLLVPAADAATDGSQG